MQSFTSGDKGFEDALKEAADAALAIEKMPEGEYDESLQPEEEPDGTEEDVYGEEEEEEEEDE